MSEDTYFFASLVLSSRCFMLAYPLTSLLVLCRPESLQTIKIENSDQQTPKHHNQVLINQKDCDFPIDFLSGRNFNHFHCKHEYTILAHDFVLND